jgi:transcriptional regulator with XRE-family HTH domain
VNDLLVLLGKRIHELRAAKNWSQEEFAHVSGLHRTYIGQIERGEKNISFDNLSKVAGVLGATLSDLLSGLENGGPLTAVSKPESHRRKGAAPDAPHRALEFQRLAKRLRLQGQALTETIQAFDEFATGGSPVRKSPRGRTPNRRSRATNK